MAGMLLACRPSVNLSELNTSIVSSGESVPTAIAGELMFAESAQRVYRVGENIPFTGKVVWFFENDNLQQETHYRDGREHGITIWWHEDGSRAGQSMHVNGLLHGPLTQWYAGGTAKEVQAIYKNGLRIGREIWWHPNGREMSAASYIKGKREGKANGWFDNGARSWEANWRGGNPEDRYLEWYPSGQLKVMKLYFQGKKHGVETWYYEHGGKSCEINWEQGVKKGILTEWFENRNRKSETPYTNGLRNGTAVGWYEAGMKSFEVVYVDDEEVAVTEWNQAGAVISSPNEPAGRARLWSAGEIEQFYKERTKDIVYQAFGEPDESGEDFWRYEGVSVAGKMCSVLFTFADKMVAAIAVTVTNES